jgi:uncharacterized protein involved in exopolysaccharide biosynthesis
LIPPVDMRPMALPSIDTIGEPDMPDFKSYDQVQREIADLEKRLGRRLTNDEVEAYEREALRKSMQDILRVLNAN